MAYLRPTRVTRPDLAIEELASAALADLGNATALDRAHALAAAVETAIIYKPDITDAHTTASEALAGGEGVCQDHAHALIAAALSQDMPARYVAGYLFASDMDDAEAPRPTSQASHAWAELFIDGLGWIGFDPANGCCPDHRYIRMCSGFDAFDAAPIRGLSSGAGEETLNVDVAVMQEQQ
jgi:transglutaminase-like putative cysteine protease